jgi:hypothetical protein
MGRSIPKVDGNASLLHFLSPCERLGERMRLLHGFPIIPKCRGIYKIDRADACTILQANQVVSWREFYGMILIDG